MAAEILPMSTAHRGHTSGPWLYRPWGPFLESPGNSTDPKFHFEIKVSRNVECVLTSNEVHFASLAEDFTAPFSKLLKLPSLMANKTA